jgi:hypothetical protein
MDELSLFLQFTSVATCCAASNTGAAASGRFAADAGN